LLFSKLSQHHCPCKQIQHAIEQIQTNHSPHEHLPTNSYNSLTTCAHTHTQTQTQTHQLLQFTTVTKRNVTVHTTALSFKSPPTCSRNIRHIPKQVVAVVRSILQPLSRDLSYLDYLLTDRFIRGSSTSAPTFF
jgi:hypothetical protein